MDSVQETGRPYEIGLVADYKLRSRHFLKDVMLAQDVHAGQAAPVSAPDPGAGRHQTDLQAHAREQVRGVKP